MKNICDINKCTGCTACYNICPRGAIEMVEDQLGFLYPKINQVKCINCGLCKKICPILNASNNISINKCYAAYAKEKKYSNNSSSGGLFPIIATKVLNENGIVIGAAFEKNVLKHIYIDNINDLIKLKGSKYLQSDLGNIFKTIKKNVAEKIVLFVGTPCQVAGLKAYLNKDYDNLITIDLICHGVPGPKVFNKYVCELEKNNNDKLISYDFRDKSTGWDTYSNCITFNNKKIKQYNYENDYMKVFLSNVALRESCYNCNFKLGNKYSDITLGDFWGIDNIIPDMYSKNGVSAIIINTNNGLKIFNAIINDIEYRDCNIESIVKYNPSLCESSKINKNRNVFLKNINKYSFKKLTKKCTDISLFKKIIYFFKKIIKKIFKR